MQNDITFENPLLASAQRRRVDQMLRQDAGGVSGFGVVQRDGGTGRGFQPTDLPAMAEQVEALAGKLQEQYAAQIDPQGMEDVTGMAFDRDSGMSSTAAETKERELFRSNNITKVVADEGYSPNNAVNVPGTTDDNDVTTPDARSGITILGFDIANGTTSDFNKVMTVLSTATGTTTRPITAAMITSLRGARDLRGQDAQDYLDDNNISFNVTAKTVKDVPAIALPAYEKIVKDTLGATVFRTLNSKAKTAIVALTWLSNGPDAMGLVKTYRNNPTDVNYAAMIKEYEEDYWEKGDDGEYLTTDHNAQRTQDVADALRSAYGANHQ